MKLWRCIAWTSVDEKHRFGGCTVRAETRAEARRLALEHQIAKTEDEPGITSNIIHWTAGGGHHITVSRQR